MKEYYQRFCKQMGLQQSTDTLHQCGTYLIGDKEITDGYLWYYIANENFIITKCDFTFTKDCLLKMEKLPSYLVIRLHQLDPLGIGKMVSFVEEEGVAMHSHLKKGTRIAYTEILYFPAFYQEQLTKLLHTYNTTPIEILKNMDTHYQWPTHVIHILQDIHTCQLQEASAELFLIAKSYELMSATLEISKTIPLKNEADYTMVQNVLNYIQHHITKPIRQSDLLRISNASATKLKTVFKQYTGSNITEYIVKCKMKKATSLLLESSYSIVTIAEMIGYQTATSFTTTFKKHMGISPSQYRQEMGFTSITNPSQDVVFINK